MTAKKLNKPPATSSPESHPDSSPQSAESNGADIVGRHKRLGRRTFLVSGLTLLSRLFGFAREMLSALLFGDTSGVYDAFITAWRVPNLFRRFLGEGALSTSLQTAMTEVDGDQGEAAGRALFRSTVSLLFWILVAVCAVAIGLVGLLPDQLPGTSFEWLGPDADAVRGLTMRLMPFVVLICLSAAIGGALQVRGNFAAPAWAPIVFNCVWILSLVVLGLSFGWSVAPAEHLEMTRWLAVGVLIAGVVQLAVQVPALVRTGLVGRIAESRDVVARHALSAGQVLKRSAPLALGAAVYQINVMIDGLMAESLLEDGGPTLHYYANRLQQFPMALIAIAATSAVFPALKALGHKGERNELRRLYDATHLGITFVALPASFALFALATPIVSVAFERGAFSAVGVERTADAVRALSLAVIPAGAVGLVARTYYALGDFTTPVRVSIVALVANVFLNLAFIRGLGLDVDGLAWGTTLTSWGHLALLLPPLRRRGLLPQSDVRWAPRIMRQSLAAVASAATAYGVYAGLFARDNSWFVLALAIPLGLLAFMALSQILDVPEWRATKARLFLNRKGS